MKCSGCGENFPDELVQSLCINGTSRSVCGVCALMAIRQAHGNPRYMFSGPRARDIYERTKRLKAKRAARADR